jgi:predicted nucleic acid-binding protein
VTRPIVDSSIAIAWCSKSQATARSEAALDAAMDFGILVPAHFQLEVANSLWQLERRNKIAAAKVDEFLGWLSGIEIDVDPTAETATPALILPVARRFDLTIYDAAYLELALRTGLPLATRDGALERAAEKAGAQLFSG